MEVSQAENMPRPPGVIQSIRLGFDAIASRISAIFLPLLFNLFFWLGPRLQMDDLFYSIRDQLILAWQSGGFSAEEIQRGLGWYEEVLPQINLFWLLRTLPVGVSSLQFAADAHTPLGVPFVWQTGAFGILGGLVFFNLFGWALGGVYFRQVAQAAFHGTNWQQPASLFFSVFHAILISIAWSIFVFALAIPALIVMAALVQINPVLANLAMLFLAFVSMWAIVPLYFLPHGIFVHGENFFVSVLNSLRLTRASLPASSMFVLTVFLLTVGLNFLWYFAPPDSWITLLAIFGQSFVATALLSASFIYYRDLFVWMKAVSAKMAAKTA